MVLPVSYFSSENIFPTFESLNILKQNVAICIQKAFYLIKNFPKETFGCLIIGISNLSVTYFDDPILYIINNIITGSGILYVVSFAIYKTMSKENIDEEINPNAFIL